MLLNANNSRRSSNSSDFQGDELFTQNSYQIIIFESND